MDPHSTNRRGRSCDSCHKDPRALGFGSGSIKYSNGKWEFVSALSGTPGISGLEHPLDAFTRIDGSSLVRSSKPGLRTFNSDEIESILYVGLCIDCHGNFDDPVMKNWRRNSPPSPCSASRIKIKNR